MRKEEIEALTQEATENWYDDGEPVESIPSGYIKVYTFGRYSEVELYKYEDFAIVYYTPTGIMRKFTDIDRAFAFARARSSHARAIENLLG